MLRTIKVILTVCMLSVLLVPRAPVTAQADSDPEPYTGETLCSPDAYLVAPQDCLALGPSSTLTDLAKKGIVFPPIPVAFDRPDPALNKLDVKYAKINLPDSEAAPIYGSLDDAVAGGTPKRLLAAGYGLRYVSYTAVNDVGGGHYVMLPTGEWMRGSPSGISSTFQGLLFNQNPQASFGWIIDGTNVHTAPSVLAPYGARQLAKNDVVQIYDLRQAEGTTFYMVGMNEWVDRHYIRQFTLNAKTPQGVDNNRWIEVNLYEQTLSVYENGQLVFATLIATGVKPYYTRPGLFKIYQKKPLETMSGAFEAGRGDFYYLADVPWTMYFDEARALHGAYWRAWFGIAQSHGCVNLSIGDSHWLYDWAKEGDWVYVWDPSGQTPTDPSLYGKGGA
jgi:lipoprotein-anchoring transpeptidase ErfK/SrfK